MTETLICLRFAEGEFPVPAPMFVKVAWSIALFIIFIGFPVWRFIIHPPSKELQQQLAANKEE